MALTLEAARDSRDDDPEVSEFKAIIRELLTTRANPEDGGNNYHDLERDARRAVALAELRLASWLGRSGLPAAWLIHHAVNLAQSTLPAPYAT